MLMGFDFHLSADKPSVFIACVRMHMPLHGHRQRGIAVLRVHMAFRFRLAAGQFPDGRIAFQGMGMRHAFLKPADQTVRKACIRMLMILLADQHRTEACIGMDVRTAFLKAADGVLVCKPCGGIAVIRMHMTFRFRNVTDQHPGLFRLILRHMFLQCADKRSLVVAVFVMHMVIDLRDAADHVSCCIQAGFVVHMRDKSTVQFTAHSIHWFRFFMIVSIARFRVHMFLQFTDKSGIHRFFSVFHGNGRFHEGIEHDNGKQRPKQGAAPLENASQCFLFQRLFRSRRLHRPRVPKRHGLLFFPVHQHQTLYPCIPVLGNRMHS